MSAQQLAIDHDAAARAGAEDRAEHDPSALARAVDGLGECKAVGVVGEANLPFQFFFQIVLQAPPIERRVVRVEHAAASRRDRAGHADAEAAVNADRFLCLGDEVGEDLQRVVIAAVRRRGAPTQPLACLVIENGELDLRAA